VIGMPCEPPLARTTNFCLYQGTPGDCSECGGYDATGNGFCGHDCAAARAERVAEQEAQQQARRAREDAFGREVERLRAEGRSYEEMDALLSGMPT
jgi:hypothetical protein